MASQFWQLTFYELSSPRADLVAYIRGFCFTYYTDRRGNPENRICKHAQLGKLLMALHPARNHHFVPKLLLKPWLIEEPPNQFCLHGYHWDPHQGKVRCKRKGLDAFCFQLDLLTLKDHNRGRDAIERLFFGEIDTKGAAIRDILLKDGPATLTAGQRCDFARLLLSLDARRPCNVTKLRTEVAVYLASKLDTDSEILAARAEEGIDETASNYVEKQLSWCPEDDALTVIQTIVDNPEVGQRLINANWDVKRIGQNDGSLVLSDRPLIRINGYDSPGATWVLPLTPHAAFIAAKHITNLRKLLKLTGQRFVKETNSSSAMQAERFVFSIENSHERWLCKRLRRTM